MKIFADVSGKAIKEYPGIFGTYRYFRKDKRGPLIWHLLNSTEPRYLIRDLSGETWKVHDHVKLTSDDDPFLSSYKRDGSFCPDDALGGYWRYYDNMNQHYEKDNSISIKCTDI